MTKQRMNILTNYDRYDSDKNTKKSSPPVRSVARRKHNKLDRLLNRAIDRKAVNSTRRSLAGPGHFKLIQEDEVNLIVAVNDILFLNAEHIYTRAYLVNERTVLHRSTFSELKLELQKYRFLQIHRSYVVNLAQVVAFDNKYVQVGNYKVPISRRSQKMVLGILRST